MGIFDLFGKKEFPDKPFVLNVQMHPMRLTAHKNDRIDLEVEVINTFHKEILASIVVVVQKPLSTDQTGLGVQREVRLGYMQPGESKHVKMNIFSTQRTDAGNYKMKVFAISHYRDYAYVLNEVRKIMDVRVV